MTSVAVTLVNDKPSESCHMSARCGCRRSMQKIQEKGSAQVWPETSLTIMAIDRERSYHQKTSAGLIRKGFEIP